MSELGSGDEGSNGSHRYQQMDQRSTDCEQGQQELGTKMLLIQSKRFYLDVKQNLRGRFIKVAEVRSDRRRSQIFFSLQTAVEFRNHLTGISGVYSNLGPLNTDGCSKDTILEKKMILRDNRCYYLDLKENARGRFLRVNQTLARGTGSMMPRCHVAIPAQGLIEFRDALTDLLDEFSEAQHPSSSSSGFKQQQSPPQQQELPEGQAVNVDNKKFYFDIGQNQRGVYMRISEVKTNFRAAITVPEKSWSRFRDIFTDYCNKMKPNDATGPAVDAAVQITSTAQQEQQLPPTSGGHNATSPSSERQ